MEQPIIKKKVLDVDDKSNVRPRQRTILIKNFGIVEVEAGKQAIEIANIQNPRVILRDMMMPKINGLTVCHIIKNNSATESIQSLWVTDNEFAAEDIPGFWKSSGYHNHGDPRREERHCNAY